MEVINLKMHTYKILEIRQKYSVNNTYLPVLRNRIRRLATDQVVMRSSPAMDIYVVHCWLINLNKLNLLSWLLAYLSDK